MVTFLNKVEGGNHMYPRPTDSILNTLLFGNFSGLLQRNKIYLVHLQEIFPLRPKSTRCDMSSSQNILLFAKVVPHPKSKNS